MFDGNYPINLRKIEEKWEAKQRKRVKGNKKRKKYRKRKMRKLF